MIVDRVRQIIEYLGVSERQFCRDNGLSHGYLDKVKTIGTGKLENILNNNPWVNPNWLTRGEGAMVMNNTGASELQEPQNTYKHRAPVAHGVPYYDVDFLNLDQLTTKKSLTPAYYIQCPSLADADCWVRVSGKSMLPQLDHGDLVALKNVENWKEFLLFGEVYAVVTEDYRTIRKVGAGKSDEYFNLIPLSENGEFTQQQIPKKIITSVFRVMGVIKKFF